MHAPPRGWRATYTAAALAAVAAGPAAAQSPVLASTQTPARVPGRAHSGIGRSIATRAESLAVVAFVDSLRAAVRRDDARAVARLVAYAPPARVWDGRRTQRVASAAAFRRLYPRVVTADLRRDVAAVTVDSLFANARGVMFADGRVWFARPDAAGHGPYRLIAVNAPLAPAGPSR